MQFPNYITFEFLRSVKKRRLHLAQVFNYRRPVLLVKHGAARNDNVCPRKLDFLNVFAGNAAVDFYIDRFADAFCKFFSFGNFRQNLPYKLLTAEPGENAHQKNILR